MPNMYSYVHDLNSWVDVFGLSGTIDLLLNDGLEGNHYKLIFNDGNKFYTTDWTELDERIRIKDGALRRYNVETKKIKITMPKNKVLKAVRNFKKESKFKGVDCFDYIVEIAELLGADKIDLSAEGSNKSIRNENNFDKIKCYTR